MNEMYMDWTFYGLPGHYYYSISIRVDSDVGIYRIIADAKRSSWIVELDRSARAAEKSRLERR